MDLIALILPAGISDKRMRVNRLPNLPSAERFRIRGDSDQSKRDHKPLWRSGPSTSEKHSETESYKIFSFLILL